MAQFIDFGNGHDGSVSSATGTINTYAAMTGTAASTTVTTALSVSAGDMVLLHQSRGTANVGKWEIVIVGSTGSGQFTATSALVNTYASVAQAVLIPQYTAGTCANALTATDWAGTSGGIIALAVNGLLTLSGSINIANKGFVYGNGVVSGNGQQAEGTSEAGGTQTQNANGNGGGGGVYTSGVGSSGGGGGGNGAAGSNGDNGANNAPGTGGSTSGNSDLTLATFGGGGGAGGGRGGGAGTRGGVGGGMAFIFAKNITISGLISGNGENGVNSTDVSAGGGGGGGSILIKAQIATLNSNKVTATAGSGGVRSGDTNHANGGNGGDGRIHLDYLTSYTGTTNPTLNATQDSSLVTASGGFFAFM